jgi:tRNA 2-thiouridine synthesizing protein E
MMELRAAGAGVNLDDEGYLVDPDDWTESVGEQLAQRENIVLSDAHWKIIHFMREYYDQHKIAPDARYIIKILSDEQGYGRKARTRLYELFPYGYAKQTCKIAGMKRPRAWSSG